MTYAASTTVPVDRSRGDLERVLARYGATSFAYGWNGDRAIVEFEAQARRVRFVLPLPDRNAPQFVRHSRGPRTPEAAYAAWEQATRQRWRALLLVVKAKLEAVEAGISEFEDEFLAHIVLPDGSTFGSWARPQIADVYAAGRMPALVPGGGS